MCEAPFGPFRQKAPDPLFPPKWRCLHQNLPNDLSMYVGQTAVDAVGAVGKGRMIDPQQVQDRGVDVVLPIFSDFRNLHICALQFSAARQPANRCNFQWSGAI